MTSLYSPSRSVLAMVKGWWRRRRCPHIGWTPLDGCPGCGQVIR